MEEAAMTFGAPEWVWGFLLLPVLAGIFLRNESRREGLLGKLVAARLLPDLAASTSAPRRRSKYALALLGLGCVNAALLQPQAGYEIRETRGRGLDVLIAVDTSKSMLSTDAQPDRLTRAKYAAQDLIAGLEGDRAGLIAFAGTSFVQAPLTIDYSAVLASLQDLDTNTIPRGGTNIASAIRQAADAFGKGEGAHRALVLFTDGEELEENALEAAKEANGKFRIFTVGVGTAAGSLIPAPGEGGGTQFVKDENGQYVKSKLDEPRLKAIAQATGGFYAHLDAGTATAKAIIEQGLKRMQAGEFEAREARPIDRYEWPLGAGILLLIASAFIRERRRKVQPTRPTRQPVSLAPAALVLIMLLHATRSGATNEGLSLYDQKDYKDAYDVFQDQLKRNPSSGGLEFDRGASAYKEGDYEKAMEAFGKALAGKDPTLRGQAEYNLANTLVERGALQQQKEEKIKEWKDALKHYDEALKVNPKDADSKYNEDLVKKMIDELNKKQPSPPPQQQQQQKQQQQQQKSGGQPQKNQQQQNQQQQNQQQQNQQQQNQQQQNQQQQNQQQQNQQQQNQQQPGQQQQKPGGQAQQNQQSNGQEKQNEQNQPSANQTGNMNSPSPTPTPGPGTLKENSQQDQQADARAAARAATEEAKPGEMTPSQAQALIDSMRGEDEHVNLYDRQQKSSEPPFRDW